jgi:hypothetical protein
MAKNNRKSSGRQTGMNIPFRRGNKAMPKSSPRSPYPKRRTGSMPDIHDKLAQRIDVGKTLRQASRFEAGRATRMAQQVLAKPETLIAHALWIAVKSKLLTGLMEYPGTGGGSIGFAPAHLEESVHPPTRRNLVDNLTYHTKIELHEGEQSRIIRAAKERYPSSSHTIWKTGSLYCADMVFACHGINQSGFWQPYTAATGGTYAPTTYDQVNRFMINGKDVYKLIQQSFATSTQLTLANSMKDNEDLLWAIDSTTNKTLFRNASELTPGVVTVYLCQFKNALANKYLYECACESDDWPAGYIPYGSSGYTKALQDSATPGATGSTEIHTDQTARLGFTPQMSTFFNTFTDVVDVFKSPVLNPGDQWDLTIKQHFRRPMSYQLLNGLYGDSPNYNVVNYKNGDYELLVQFQGAPGFANNEKSTSTDFKRVATNSNPMMLTCTQSRSIQYNFQSSEGATMNDLDNFTANTVREVDVSPRVSNYFGDAQYNYRAVGMTETESKVANESGIGEAMVD